MGVIHKFNEEVVQFIIEQKKSNPKLSCRKLAEAASATFQVKLSKSSVNTILKNAGLSSSVGRRSSGAAPKQKKFKIPEQKKKELFTGIPKPIIIEGDDTAVEESSRPTSEPQASEEELKKKKKNKRENVKNAKTT